MDYIRSAHMDDIALRSARQTEASLKRGWRVATLLMLLTALLMSCGYYRILMANLSVEVKFVRIDGVEVKENFDARRDVLIENIQRRRALMQSPQEVEHAQ